MPARFWPPAAEPAVLTRHPAELLTAVEEDAEPAVSRIAGDLALALTIGVPPGEPLTRRRDLDNYLLPVVPRLGQRRIPAVFARKVHADASALTVGPARLRPDDRPPVLRVRTTGPCEQEGWREQVRDACAAAVGTEEPGSGPVRLDLAFELSSVRNWTTLWKPTLDALGPLLGVPDPERPWAPADDRVVALGLHRTIDDRVGSDVVISAWWSSPA